MRRQEANLDPRGWLLWGVAAGLPPLLGRNPLPLLAVLVAVFGVRAAWGEHTPRLATWSGIARLAAVFAVIGALFNVLTVRSGDQVLFRLPESIPIFGGAVTLNALVFGLLSGLALLILVLVGATVGALLDWSAALRLMPARLTTVAVAGSVAFAFIPQTTVAFREIREAQAARGHRLRGVRDLLPLLVPLLTGGLERAIILAEALESRAFGAPAGPVTSDGRWRSALIAVGLAAGVTAGFLLAVGQMLAAGVALAVAVATVAVATRGTGQGPRRTRYRPVKWTRRDTIAAAGALGAGVATLVAVAVAPAALRYEPYPELVAPWVSLPLIAAQAGLLVPAFLVGRPNGGREDHP